MRDLGTALLVVVALSGCGEDGQGIRDPDQKCVEQTPFYTYADTDAPNTPAGWASRRRHLDGTSFTAKEEQDLQAAIDKASSGPQRCLTPTGHALTLGDAGP